ncbi:MAG: hypothetical protein QOF83_1609 [Solirubrobacteraceae bacterium]|nr:hypothetical protein [Solirubrobacteraceae bacterium]
MHGSRPSAGEIRLALSGAWHGPGTDAGQEPLLVVQIEGRRHRFPADRDDRNEELAPGRWRATFSVPDWAQPRHEGQAAVWIGNVVIPVPPLHGSHHAPPALAAAIPAPRPDAYEPPQAVHESEVEPEGSQSEPRPEGEGGIAEPPSPASPWPPDVGRSPLRSAPPEAPRSGPLADLLLKETVAALHTELEQRMAHAARLQGALGDARAELEARTTTQSQLEATLGELSVELKRLMGAVEEQRTELEQHREQARTEREELERRLSDLTEAHERQAAELTEAHAREVAELNEIHARDAAALTTRHEERLTQVTTAAEQRGAEAGGLREELAASQVAREAALSEVAGLQSELSRIGAELAVTRERVTSESGDLGQANRLLAEAKALAEQLRRERGG